MPHYLSVLLSSRGFAGAGWLALACALACAPAAAATRTWPGVAPCEGTLQACVDASAAADVIEIATTTPIDESLTIVRSLTLRSAAGVKARFAEFNSVIASAGAGAPPLVLLLEDLQLLNGNVRTVQSGDADLHVEVRRLRIATTFGLGSIVVSNSGTGSSTARVENNDVDVVGDDFSTPPGISFSSTGGGTSDVSIRFNRITAQSLGQAAVVSVYNSGGTLAADVFANRIEGDGFNSGLSISSDGGGSTSAWLLDNVVRGQVGEAGRPGAIVAHSSNGSLEVQVLNNTIADNEDGIRISARTDLGGVVTGSVANNIVAGNRDGGIRIDSELEPGVANRNNLLYRNGFNEFTPGTGTLEARPLFLLDGFRVGPASPAVDAGDTALVQSAIAIRGLPLVDVDGLRRVKDGLVDIGAFEAGTSHHLHTDRMASTSNNVTIVQWGAVDGLPNVPVLFTPNWNPPGLTPVYNDAYTGIYYFSGDWLLFNEGVTPTVEDMPQGASFNLVRTDPDGAFGHLVDSGNQAGFTTVLDDPVTNSAPDKVLQVAHHWNGHGSSGVYFDAPFGVGYLGSNWLLVNLDDAAVPLGVGFTVYAQDPSQSAWRHVMRAGDVVLNWGYLPHPLLDGVACAQIQVTRGVPGSSEPFGVWYDDSRGQWAVFHQNTVVPMPAGDEFHVLLDPAQIDFCSGIGLFADGFE